MKVPRRERGRERERGEREEHDGVATAQAAAATAAESDQESSGRRRRRDTLTSYLNAWIGRSESGMDGRIHGARIDYEICSSTFTN